jgi:glycosyltransferase involved in cell wall biosynthesis
VSRVILHVARGREWRGGEQQVLLLVGTLAARHSLPQLVLTSHGARLEHELRAASLPVAGIPWRGAWDPRALRALSGQLRRLTHEGQQPLLHAHDSHALGLALLCGWRHRVPVIATRRSMAPPGKLWRRPACVIAISRAVAASLGRNGVPSARIAVIPSAAADEFYQEICGQVRSTTPVRLLAVGALTPEKGHLTLVRALAALPHPDSQLTLCGEGPERRSIDQLVESLGLARRVRIKTTVEPEDFRQATLFIQPSVREALGTAVLRAMAQGVPVVASRTGGLVELLEGGAGVLVAPGEPHHLAAAITALLGDPVRLALLGQTGRRRVENYRPARMADQVADVYASGLVNRDR